MPDRDLVGKVDATFKVSNDVPIVVAVNSLSKSSFGDTAWLVITSLAAFIISLHTDADCICDISLIVLDARAR